VDTFLRSLVSVVALNVVNPGQTKQQLSQSQVYYTLSLNLVIYIWSYKLNSYSILSSNKNYPLNKSHILINVCILKRAS
jgi:hypothetical protein